VEGRKDKEAVEQHTRGERKEAKKETRKSLACLREKKREPFESTAVLADWLTDGRTDTLGVLILIFSLGEQVKWALSIDRCTD